jgi:hypothetical protein
MTIGTPRYPHQLGMDVGVINDGTAIAITYPDGDKIVLAYHEYWQAGVDWRESNPHLGSNYPTDYARTLQNVDRLDFDEIVNWVMSLSKRFHITDGLYDQWQGMSMEQTFMKKGFTQMRAEFFTRDVTSKMYQAVKTLMWDHKLVLYDYPAAVAGAQVKHSPLIAELLTLQAEQFSRNVTVVSAPEHPGYHDDMSDALIRAIWLSHERLGNMKHVYNSHPDRLHANVGPTLAAYQMGRARKHGVFTERMRPRGGGGGRVRGRVR